MHIFFQKIYKRHLISVYEIQHSVLKILCFVNKQERRIQFFHSPEYLLRAKQNDILYKIE